MSEPARPETDASTAVTILGRTYRLRGTDDAAYLSELADLVDEKMREIESATGTADSLKVAILASLNIADDYLKASRGVVPTGRRRTKVVTRDHEKRVAKMVALLDEVLEE